MNTMLPWMRLPRVAVMRNDVKMADPDTLSLPIVAPLRSPIDNVYVLPTLNRVAIVEPPMDLIDVKDVTR